MFNSIIEIQLLVICPALCTLRAFARHISPKLMGDSTQRTDTNRYKSSLRTYGRTSRKEVSDKYAIADDEGMFPLNSMAGRGGANEVTVTGHSRKRLRSPSSEQTLSDNRTWDARPDDDLERHIIQTTEVTITESLAATAPGQAL
jgi:hypothetical protein